MIANEAEFMKIARQVSLSEGSDTDLEEWRRRLRVYDARNNPTRKGDWFAIYSGRRFWPLDPRAEDIDPVDIAHSLSMINRFNGHSKRAYCVGQHSCLVSYLVPKRLRLFALLHDAGECYLGDVITPIKRFIRELYEPLEEGVMQAVARRFNFEINDDDRYIVKQADLQMLANEARDLTTTGVLNLGANYRLPKPSQQRITRCWSSEEAEATFLTELDWLVKHG